MSNTVLVGSVKYDVSRERTRQLAERVAELEDALRGAQWCLDRASTIHVRDRDLTAYYERRQTVHAALKGNHADAE